VVTNRGKVEKAVIERSGATGEGLSAINCYMGQRYGWNTPEDFVRYVVNDMMDLAREQSCTSILSQLRAAFTSRSATSPHA